MKMSNLGDLYRNIIFNDESCVKFLKERGLLPNSNVCTKLNATGEVCGGDMKETLKNSRKRDANGQLVKTKYMRCQTRGCQKWQSIRSQNPFFTYMDKNGKNKSGLSLCEIIELVWCWVNKFKVAQTEKITGRGHHTVSDWFNLCRDVVAEQFNKRGKMGGKGLIVQIDESIFQGKRKYNRGRLRLGDCKPVDNEDTDGKTTDSSEDNSNEENQNDQNENYGSRVQGPWVFGMCCLREDGILERRFLLSIRGIETHYYQ
ncbi:uncharacterized protein LOC126554818 [Aphis gossypii]|uniref:uncharacterized protein LOC126554818 n=1 Tax=Aphis gossypii TaxID=80765 RepID=UPI00215969E6|nr:uncharacterized protein LOC126554818 [Aphis gossypii]